MHRLCLRILLRTPGRWSTNYALECIVRTSAVVNRVLNVCLFFIFENNGPGTTFGDTLERERRTRQESNRSTNYALECIVRTSAVVNRVLIVCLFFISENNGHFWEQWPMNDVWKYLIEKKTRKESDRERGNVYKVCVYIYIHVYSIHIYMHIIYINTYMRKYIYIYMQASCLTSAVRCATHMCIETHISITCINYI